MSEPDNSIYYKVKPALLIEKLTDGKFQVTDDYDRGAIITAEELFRLGTEIQRIAAQGKDIVEAFIVGEGI